MFCKYDQDSYREAFPGIRMKTLVYGEKTLMTEFLLEGGSFLPAHDHIHEQTGYLVSGKIFLTIGEERLEVNPGNSWNVPGGFSHNAESVEDSVAVEVFSLRRDEYII